MSWNVTPMDKWDYGLTLFTNFSGENIVIYIMLTCNRFIIILMNQSIPHLL